MAPEKGGAGTSIGPSWHFAQQAALRQRTSNSHHFGTYSSQKENVAEQPFSINSFSDYLVYFRRLASFEYKDS
jgi:hypothetical protein